MSLNMDATCDMSSTRGIPSRCTAVNKECKTAHDSTPYRLRPIRCRAWLRVIGAAVEAVNYGIADQEPSRRRRGYGAEISRSVRRVESRCGAVAVGSIVTVAAPFV